MKKLVTIIMTVVILASLTLTSFAITFSDIPENAWYKSFVYDLAEEGVINGYEENGMTIYKPENQVTVAEFMKLIVTSSAPDIKYDMIEADFEHWAAKYLKVLENVGVVLSGEYTATDIDRPILRIEVVRLLSKCDVIMRQANHVRSQKTFTDTQDVSETDMVLLRHAVGIGVINGDPEGTFRPNDGLKRSESAKIIYTYLNSNN